MRNFGWNRGFTVISKNVARFRHTRIDRLFFSQFYDCNKLEKVFSSQDDNTLWKPNWVFMISWKQIFTTSCGLHVFLGLSQIKVYWLKRETVLRVSESTVSFKIRETHQFGRKPFLQHAVECLVMFLWDSFPRGIKSFQVFLAISKAANLLSMQAFCMVSCVLLWNACISVNFSLSHSTWPNFKTNVFPRIQVKSGMFV